MKNILLVFILITAIFLQIGCSSEKSDSNTSDDVEREEQISDIPIDFTGKYEGIAPCENCVGVFTTITINANQTYSMNAVYLGKSEETFQAEGNFTWNAGENKITLENIPKGAGQYLVKKNSIIQLDSNGKLIEGTNASKYVFKKVK